MQNFMKVSVTIAGVSRGSMIDLGGEKTPAGLEPLMPWAEGVDLAVGAIRRQMTDEAIRAEYHRAAYAQSDVEERN